MPGNQEPGPAVELEPASDATPEQPAVEESPEPQTVQTPPESAIESPLEAEPASEAPPEPPLEMLPPPTARVEPEDVTPRPVERVVHAVAPSPVQTWLRPRPVQLNEGRIEVSVPYYVGAIASIVLLMVVLVAYRLGQARPGGQGSDAGRPAEAAQGKSVLPADPPTRTTPANATTSGEAPLPANPRTASTAGQGASPVASQGDNWIVLVKHKNGEDLVPVQDFYARYGIDLFILPLDQAPAIFAQFGLDASRLPAGPGFLLVTKNAYDNPNVAGSEGSKMVKRIAEVGALYKAHTGDKLFAPNYFGDAYGMKIR